MGTRHRTREQLPSIGDLLILSATASIQFQRPIPFRVIKCLPWSTYVGWCWVRGYQLDELGEAVDERDVFVQIDGLRYISESRP